MERFIFSESTLCKQLMQMDLSAASAHLQHWEWPLILPYWGGYTNTNYKQQLWRTRLLLRAQHVRPALWSLRREKGRSAFILGWLGRFTSLRADAACGTFVEIPSLPTVSSIYVEEATVRSLSPVLLAVINNRSLQLWGRGLETGQSIAGRALHHCIAASCATPAALSSGWV